MEQEGRRYQQHLHLVSSARISHRVAHIIIVPIDEISGLNKGKKDEQRELRKHSGLSRVTQTATYMNSSVIESLVQLLVVLIGTVIEGQTIREMKKKKEEKGGGDNRRSVFRYQS